MKKITLEEENEIELTEREEKIYQQGHSDGWLHMGLIALGILLLVLAISVIIRNT